MIHGGTTWTKRTSWVVSLIANGLCEQFGKHTNY